MTNLPTTGGSFVRDGDGTIRPADEAARAEHKPARGKPVEAPVKAPVKKES